MGYQTIFLAVSLLVSAVQAQNSCGAVQVQSFGAGNEVTATPRGTAILRCVATFTPSTSEPISYTWYHMDELEQSAISNGNMLQIGNFQASDGGVYQCLASTTSCTTERSPPFNVNIVPEIAISGDSPLMVVDGSSFTLTCTAAGWPTPTIQWRRLTSEGRITIQTGGMYTVGAASPSDGGLYECTASNSVSQFPVVGSILVEVIAPPLTTEIMMTSASSMSAVSESDQFFLPSNGTDLRDFYIAVGVTAGVSFMLGFLSVLCCVITLCANHYASTPKVVDPYDDWPDGEEETKINAGDQVEDSKAYKSGEEVVVIEANVEEKEPEEYAEEEPLDTVAELQEPVNFEEDDERNTVTASEIGEFV